ncbi:hypothetical protein EVAR_100170_1 [Eumeta japonica]|uniref:Uncharacterized protein n=1 Tax=Eumeta variegata TaxID=151549 RepID=A0A4C2A9D8_EUMVA|nr:hypothetical protein EVAR_100170_1 [Eumeta japonica]
MKKKNLSRVIRKHVTKARKLFNAKKTSHKLTAGAKAKRYRKYMLQTDKTKPGELTQLAMTILRSFTVTGYTHYQTQESLKIFLIHNWFLWRRKRNDTDLKKSIEWAELVYRETGFRASCFM